MSTVAQSISMNAHGGITRLNEGNKTQVIYGMIRDGKYADVIKILTNELNSHPRSRAALSLLGYTYYFMQDFANAAAT